MEEKYALWCENPHSVEESWSAFFEGFELGATRAEEQEQAELAMNADVAFFGRVVALIYNYRTLGHTQAHIDPLNEAPPQNPRLAYDQFGLSEADLDREAWNAFFRHGERMKLRDMIAALEATYSGYIGFEFMHIHHTPVRHWLRERFEARLKSPIGNPSRQLSALRWVLEAEAFETFLGKRFLGEKRFSNEGGEGVMILLNAILENCPANGVREIEMGMSHRGRLNVLANFVRKALPTVLY
ncbi:MAG: 2-oxoglutarate dehydrogenase E1 subunit family protein, partial [Verrucomicrobiales bacterium]